MAFTKAELKKLASLKTKEGRGVEKRFLAEGVRVLEEAHKFDFLPVKLFYLQAGLSERGENLVKQFKSNRIEIISVTKREMDVISDTDSTQGIAAVFNVPESNFSKLYKLSYRKLLLCDRIIDPGNLGTLIRTALAFEIDMILVTDDTVEIFNPKVVRAAAGAIFGLPTAKASYQELKQFKISLSAKFAVTVAQPNIRNGMAEMSELNQEEKSPLILAVGSEAEGLSQEILSMADYTLTIKHNPQVESLNAAVAGAILMHSIYDKQRNQASK